MLGLHILVPALLYFLSGFTRRNRRKVVFGSWMGKKFADNPKFLLLYFVEQGFDLDLVWIADEVARPLIPPDLPVRFVRRGSMAAWRELLTAGSCFITHDFTDVCRINLLRGARKVYLGHGLAIKHMGSRDTRVYNRAVEAVRRLIRYSYAFDHYIASAPVHLEKLLVENATCNIVRSQVMACGQPRIDFLLKHTGIELASAKARFLNEHNIPPGRRVITYLPTFRGKGAPVFSFATMESKAFRRLQSVLTELDAIIIEKGHFAGVLQGRSDNHATSDRIYSLSGSAHIDTQELLLASDLLITDYSGCYVDFLALKRPVLHFAYDRKYYESRDRGLYFDLDEIAGGPVVEDLESLYIQIAAILKDPDRTEAAQSRARMKLTEYEQGNACEQLSRAVLGLSASSPQITIAHKATALDRINA